MASSGIISATSLNSAIRSLPPMRALLSPSLVLIGGLIVFPILYNVWLSLFDKHSFMPAQTFVGLQNYAYFARDPDFWSSAHYGLVYAGKHPRPPACARGRRRSPPERG